MAVNPLVPQPGLEPEVMSLSPKIETVSNQIQVLVDVDKRTLEALGIEPWIQETKRSFALRDEVVV
jgi:hypothetical protein